MTTKDMRPEVFDLKRDLAALGWLTLAERACCMGYKPDTVRRVIRRHWCTDSKQRGEKTLSITEDVRNTLKYRIKKEMV